MIYFLPANRLKYIHIWINNIGSVKKENRSKRGLDELISSWLNFSSLANRGRWINFKEQYVCNDAIQCALVCSYACWKVTFETNIIEISKQRNFFLWSHKLSLKLLAQKLMCSSSVELIFIRFNCVKSLRFLFLSANSAVCVGMGRHW